MRAINIIIAFILICMLSACTGQPVYIGSMVDGPIPTGRKYIVSTEKCGFQLFSFIPMGINNRHQIAYSRLELQANGDFLTNVKIRERWTYGFAGTSYCTAMEATAIHPDSADEGLDNP